MINVNELRVLTLQAAQLVDKLTALWKQGRSVYSLKDKAHNRLTRRYAKYVQVRDHTV